MLARWFAAASPILTEPVQAPLMTILIVEDDSDVAESMASVVLLSGPRRLVETVRTAEDALELLNTRRYAVVIADYRLSGMDGVAFLQEVLRREPTARAILASASPDRARAAAREADLPADVAFLPKPFGAAELARLVAA